MVYTTDGAKLTRRKVAAGTAWFIPTIVTSSAAPAMAASGCTPESCNSFYINLDPTETRTFTTNGLTGYNFFGLPVGKQINPCSTDTFLDTNQEISLTIKIFTYDNKPDLVRMANFDYYNPNVSSIAGNSVTITAQSDNETVRDLENFNINNGQDFDSFTIEVDEREDPYRPFEIQLSIPFKLTGGICNGQTVTVTRSWYIDNIKSF